MEEIQAHLKQAQRVMEKVYVHIQKEFTHIRAGRVVPNMLDGILVMYHGNETPINHIASISTPDARTLVIKPWEPHLIPALEKAILGSNLGCTPQNDGKTIRITIPPLTEERRKAIVKQVKSVAENGRVAIRNARRERRESFKKLQKEGLSQEAVKMAEEQTQKLTDNYIKKLDALLAHKEAEVMAV